LHNCIPASQIGNQRYTFGQESDSDATSEKSVLHGRDLPSQYDKENNYYMLYWKTYLENE